MEKIHDVKPRELSDSMVIVAPFDEAKKELESDGYRIVSLEENARLRMQEGKDAFVSRNGNWTREAFVYDPKTNLWYLTKDSPIMENPIKATRAHRNGKEYFLNGKQLSKALENSVQVTDREIPTNRFGEDKLAVYAFGSTAKDYGLFLVEAKNIKEMPIWLPGSEEKPYARQLWFRSLGGRSDLDGYDRDLRYWMRGVRPQNFSTGNK